MQPVRLEEKAWADPRFTMLAGYCGFADPDLALIKCGRLWSYCTEKGCDTFSADVIDACVRIPGFAKHLVRARLAEKTKVGVRIKGTRGRIEWLEKLRSSASKGGHAKAAKALANGSRLAEQMPADAVPEVCPSPAEALPSYSFSYSSSLSLPENKSHPPKPDTSSARAREGLVSEWFAKGFDSKSIVEIFSTLRVGAGGGSLAKLVQRDYERGQHALAWAVDYPDPLAACGRSIANFLHHATGLASEGWPFWAWANDPGRWHDYVPPKHAANGRGASDVATHEEHAAAAREEQTL